MRKSITSLLSAATMAVALVGGSTIAAPGTAEAAGCAKWQLPLKSQIIQSNKALVNLTYGTDGYWHASHGYSRSNDVMFSSATARSVRFVITWTNGTGGVYTGTIDSDGFVSGQTVDRFNPRSRASWTMTRLAKCVRR